MGKSTISMVMFNSFLYVYQRVMSTKFGVVIVNPIHPTVPTVPTVPNRVSQGISQIWRFHHILCHGIFGGLRALRRMSWKFYWLKGKSIGHQALLPSNMGFSVKFPFSKGLWASCHHGRKDEFRGELNSYSDQCVPCECQQDVKFVASQDYHWALPLRTFQVLSIQDKGLQMLRCPCLSQSSLQKRRLSQPRSVHQEIRWQWLNQWSHQTLVSSLFPMEQSTAWLHEVFHHDWIGSRTDTISPAILTRPSFFPEASWRFTRSPGTSSTPDEDQPQRVSELDRAVSSERRSAWNVGRLRRRSLNHWLMQCTAQDIALQCGVMCCVFFVPVFVLPRMLLNCWIPMFDGKQIIIFPN